MTKRPDKPRRHVLISPGGSMHLVTNAARFSREQRLSASKVREMLRGERNYHKGWTVC